MKTIVLSAGHNPGTDSGAVGQGQQEANENVKMVDRIAHYLSTWKIPVVVMPHNIGDLTTEIKWVNDRYAMNSAYAIQVHRNAGGGTGNEVWTTAYANQIPLATAILKAMTELTKLTSRGVKDIKTSNWPLGWINYVNCESVLIEARFIDRDSITDADDYLDAYSIACGIADFMGVARGKSVEQLAVEAQAAAAAAAKAAQEAEAAKIAAAKAEADRLAAEKAKLEAEKAAQDALNQENLNILEIILKALKAILTALKALKAILTAILGKK